MNPSSSRRDFLQLASAAALTAGATQVRAAVTPPPAGPSGEIWRWDATDVADAIRSGRISSRDAVQSILGRISAVNPRVNAVVEVMVSEALAAADAADAAVRAGGPLGVLHGVPVTVKVNTDVKGHATTNGIVANRNLIAPEDGPVASNLRRAGAVIVGRSNTPSFSWRWFTENDLHGRTLNPWKASVTPGGSSGGAAAAVAAGMGPLAHGNDIAGSIRYPAYACGVAGLRPSMGRIASFNPTATTARGLASQFMSVQGPLARRVRDLRLGLAAMAMRDPRDPLWTDMPLERPGSRKPLRVALVTGIAGIGMDTDPAVRDALVRSARSLEAAGYRVDEVAPPHLKEAFDLWMLLAMNEARIGMMPAIGKLGDEGIRRAAGSMLANTPEVDLPAYMAALARRDTIRREWSVFMAEHPLILMPVSLRRPFAQGLDTQGDAVMKDILAAQSPLMSVAALSLPGLSVPTGAVDGVPMGVQLVAGTFREDLCLAAGEVIERSFPMATPVEPHVA